MVDNDATEIAAAFWRLMATNDFNLVASVLADDFVLEWPQSKERIRGAENFVRMNQEYPANGIWTFKVNRIVGSASEAVSDVSITDGTQAAQAISFFTVSEGKVVKIVEFWPEPYAASADRAHLTETID